MRVSGKLQIVTETLGTRWRHIAETIRNSRYSSSLQRMDEESKSASLCYVSHRRNALFHVYIVCDDGRETCATTCAAVTGEDATADNMSARYSETSAAVG